MPDQPADAALIRRLEELCFNAWPTLRTVLVDGCVVRIGDGHARRANSANPVYPVEHASPQWIDAVSRLFVVAHLPVVWRLTPLAPSNLADMLRTTGHVEDDASFGLHTPDFRLPPLDLACRHEAAPSDRWLGDAMAAYGFGAKAAASLRRMFADPVFETVFVTLSRNGRDIAWGIGVAEGEYVGLFDLVVAPEARGTGAGRQLVGHILAWGHERGARHGYLQVRESNRIARKLYDSLGFQVAYRYTHYVRPAA